MAAKEPQKASGHRVVVVLSLLALTADSAVAFGRIFQGDAPAVHLALAAGIAVLLAAAFEHRSIGLATVVSAAGLAVAAGLIVYPSTTRYGLPMLETFRMIGSSFGAVSRDAAAEVAPAAPLAPLLLAGLLATWAAAFASHTLAVRARSPFLALLPPSALVAFASLIVRDGARPLYVVPFVLGALGLLIGESMRSLSAWGPVVGWRGRRGRVLATAGSLRGARRAGMACLAVAVFTPWILPGFKHPGAVDVRAKNNPTHVSLDPLVDIRPQLLSNPPVVAFRVRSDHPSYWRVEALDRFTGESWLASGSNASSGPAAQLGAGSTTASVDTVIHQHVVFDRFSQPWLPSAFDPASVGENRDPIQLDPRTGMLFAPNGTYRGFSYAVDSIAAAPSSADLDQVGSFAQAPGSTPLTELPSSMPAQISAIAHRLADHQPTTYRKVVAIQDYLLSSRFTYNERVKPTDGVNAVLDFLTRSRKGYCQQFAGTMAVLLRALGIPARVAIGYTPGAFDPKTLTYTVSTTNAHAWVEVLFPRYGWLAFEPTPGRANPVASPYVQIPASSSQRSGSTPCRIDARLDGVCASPAPLTPRDSRGGGGTNIPRRKRLENGPGAVRRRQAASHGHHEPVVLAVVALAALLLVLVPLAKLVSRRLSVAAAREPSERALAAYRRMSATAADVGLARVAAETLQEYQDRLRGQVSTLDGDLDRLTRIAGRAAYSEDGVSRDEADQAVEAAGRVARTIARAGGPVRRVAGLFRITPIRTPR
jgi:transglutaminase-like putative cysteine protease